MTKTTDIAASTKRHWKRGLAAVTIVLVAAVGFAALQRNPFGKASPESTMPLFEVKQGPLTISVTEAGTIQAREQVVIQSEVEGQTTIIFLIPEGAQVKKGDLLVELDASSLVDQRVDQEISVQNAEASFIRARENLEVVKNQAQSDIDKAELDYEFAKQDLGQYIEGQFPKDLKEAQSKISLASEELQRAEEKLKWSRILFNEKYLSQSELQADDLAANKARLDLELAVTNLNLLKEFTYKRELASLQSDVSQAEMALERTRRKANADVVQAEADLRAKESEFGRQKDKLKKIGEQITKTRIEAPQDGMVVYATSAQVGWHGNTEPLEEGQQVREREELIYLPTADSFKAEVKVHESSLDKISLGLPVRITVDALPGRTFSGKVGKIAPLPDAQSVFMNPDLKVYNTEIHIDNETKELRTGMSCQAEIIVTRYADALYVPVQAVLKVEGTPSVYLMQEGRRERRPVELGLDNNRMVRVVSGLQAGDQVLLTPPLASATLHRDEEGETPADAPQDGVTGPAPVTEPGDAPAAETAGPSRPADSQQRSRPDWGNMSDEQRAEMRQRFENMSPEEREQMRQRWMQREGASGRSSSGEPRGERSPQEREAMRQRRPRQDTQESSADTSQGR